MLCHRALTDEIDSVRLCYAGDQRHADFQEGTDELRLSLASAKEELADCTVVTTRRLVIRPDQVSVQAFTCAKENESTFHINREIR